MSKRSRENIIILLIITLIGVYLFFNVNYYDRYLLKSDKSTEERK